LGDTLKHGVLIHAGFFLGPQQFYDALNEMSEEERKCIFMTSVLNVNQLYDNKYAKEELKVLQRKHARFVNAALMVTLSGAVVSDGLENGQVVSGVGGQYNFVSMAHALPDGRSILMAKSTRSKGKAVSSNVVWNYGHITIPRHLRDFVITEYGIADLRGKNDKQIITALLNITDSRFQDELLSKAKAAKKIPKDCTISDHFRNNTPQRIADDLASFRKQGYFPPFPFGTDFTDEELAIGKSLRQLKETLTTQRIPVPLPSLGQARKMISVPEAAWPYLKRLALDKPQSNKERMMQRLVVYALSASGQI
jgi:acyl-CoA hydrolase